MNALLPLGLITATVTAVSIAAGPTQADALFNPASTFTVNVGGAGTPAASFTHVEPLVGSESIGNGINLNSSIVAVDANTDWLVFHYTSVNGPIGTPGVNWTMNQVGVQSLVPVDFIADFTQFSNANGVPFNQTNHIFNQGFLNNPVPGGMGNGEGTTGFSQPQTNPMGSLGAFADPFNVVTNALGTTQVFDFYQALEFTAQTAVNPPPPPSVPEPAGIAILGVGLLGLVAARRRA
jgi:hypothetical protein